MQYRVPVHAKRRPIVLGRIEARAESVACDSTNAATADRQAAIGPVAAAVAAAYGAEEDDFEDEVTVVDDPTNGHRDRREKIGVDQDAVTATNKQEVGKHLPMALQDSGREHRQVSVAHVVC